MKVIIETIDHKDQPYDTCGDWRFENGSGNPISQSLAMLSATAGADNEVLRIRVSKLGDWRYEMLVAVHELCETLMCMHDGVLVEDVDRFDKAFEARKQEQFGNLTGYETVGVDDGANAEPGDDPAAPYVKQHCIATAVERLMCAQLGCDWKTYDDKVFSLPTIPAKE